MGCDRMIYDQDDPAEPTTGRKRRRCAMSKRARKRRARKKKGANHGRKPNA